MKKLSFIISEMLKMKKTLFIILIFLQSHLAYSDEPRFLSRTILKTGLKKISKNISFEYGKSFLSLYKQKMTLSFTAIHYETIYEDQSSYILHICYRYNNIADAYYIDLLSTLNLFRSEKFSLNYGVGIGFIEITPLYISAVYDISDRFSIYGSTRFVVTYPLFPIEFFGLGIKFNI